MQESTTCEHIEDGTFICKLITRELSYNGVENRLTPVDTVWIGTITRLSSSALPMNCNAKAIDKLTICLFSLYLYEVI